MPRKTDFLGTGWSFPPTFNPYSTTVEMVSDETDIHQSLIILFSTRLGERIMVPQYGTPLERTIFKSLTTTLISQIKNIVEQAVLNWEARINVDDVQVTQDVRDMDLVLINLIYTIRRTNARSNLVYPFYLKQGTIPAKSP